MKKLVAISVLFAGLAMAVFAQDGGWSNAWKAGLTARFVTDMFYAAKADGSTKTTNEATGSPTTSNTVEYGKYAKGVVHFFPNQRTIGLGKIGGDSRLGLQLSNEGENYGVRVNIDWDDWGAGFDNGNGKTVFEFLQGQSDTDWGIKGTAGIFSLGIGPWATEAAWVGTSAIWGSWIGWNHLNRFGVRRADGGGQGDGVPGWLHSDHFRSGDVWGTPFSVGMALGDNFKFTVGYNLRASAFGWWWSPTIGDPKKDSKSSINGKFMLSGKPVDAITFDLFYSVVGADEDTSARPVSNVGYTLPEAYWRNLIGAYVGISAIENLALSVGYTVSFNAYEAGSWLDPSYTVSGGADPATVAKAVTYNAPIYSGIDLRVGYSGIDKIGLKFLTNVSFAGVKGEKVENTSHKSKVNLLFDETTYNAEGINQDWFSWHAILSADLGFIDGVGLEVALGNLLSVTNTTQKYTNAASTSYDISNKTTEEEFRVTVGANYGVGNVSLGVALFLQLNSSLSNIVNKTSSSGSSSTVSKVGTDNLVSFGIPIYFQVSF